MSAMTLTAPLARPRLLVLPPVRRARVAAPRAARPVVSRPAVRPAAVRPVAARPVAAGHAAQAPTLRLTARGRLVLLLALVGLATAVSLFSGAVSLAGTSSAPVPVRYVTVEQGQSLWAIAGDVAPGADRRDTVSRILELNALPGSGVRAGQRLAVPAAG